MSKIDDLKKSISEMSTGELMDELKTIRSNRRVSKKSPAKKKAKKTIDISSMLSALDPQSVQSLLKELGDKDDTK